ncbi:acetoin utilization protein AcuC [Marinitoga arctica]
MVNIVWSDKLLEYDFGEGHPLRSKRCKLGIEKLFKSNIEYTLISPRYAEENELALFHTIEYINQVKNNIGGSSETPIRNMYNPARLSVGATLSAIESITENEKIAVNLCGGWHHTFEDKARGFCIFNDVVIGAKYAQKLGYEKIMIIDWDVHHGDGTQRAFLEDNSVYTISIHQHPETQYPYISGYERENTITNLNIPIFPGTSEQEILTKVLSTIPNEIRMFKPDMLIIQMGVDGYKLDPMSSIDLSERFYKSLSIVLSRCSKKNRFPVVLLGGGGFYFPKTAEIWELIIRTFEEDIK